MRSSLNNIVRIKNFVSAQQIDNYVNYCDEVFAKDIDARTILQADNETRIAQDIKSYRSRVQRAIEDHCGFSVVDLSGTTIRKWYPGESQDPHADCEAVFFRNSDGIQMEPINNFSSIFIEYAALTYLNDDYEGGEIYFPEYGLEIKPKAGELIFFPGSHFYEHGVNEVVSGNRYAVMTFFTTPKLQYLWRKFVLDPIPLEFEKRTEYDSMNVPTVFDRSNVPNHMKNFGAAQVVLKASVKEEPKFNPVAEKESIKDLEVPDVEVVSVAPPPPKEETPLRDTPHLFGKDSSMIKILDDFISDEDVDAVMEMAESITEWNPCGEDVYNENGVLVYSAEEWKDRLCGADILERINEAGYKILKDNAMRVKEKAEELFNCELKFREPALVRYRAGMHEPEPHADKQASDGSYKPGMADWDLSAVMYFNSDFEGGELVFPQHGFAIVPSPGRVVIYPGDSAYLHYVDNVTSGVRWACPLFFTVIEKN